MTDLNTAYLSLGSNIDAETNLPAAVRALAKFGVIAAVSSVWETEPFGDPGQPNFLNAAVKLQTAKSAQQLRLEVIPQIEHGLQRVRDPDDYNAPRTIDVDLSLFNRDVLNFGKYRIPDPDILSRAFVAVPLAETDPDYVHPEIGRPLTEIAATLKTQQSEMQLRADVALPRSTQS